MHLGGGFRRIDDDERRDAHAGRRRRHREEAHAALLARGDENQIRVLRVGNEELRAIEHDVAAGRAAAAGRPRAAATARGRRGARGLRRPRARRDRIRGEYVALLENGDRRDRLARRDAREIRRALRVVAEEPDRGRRRVDGEERQRRQALPHLLEDDDQILAAEAETAVRFRNRDAGPPELGETLPEGPVERLGLRGPFEDAIEGHLGVEKAAHLRAQLLLLLCEAEIHRATSARQHASGRTHCKSAGRPPRLRSRALSRSRQRARAASVRRSRGRDSSRRR